MLARRLKPLRDKVLTMTFDNGNEFAHHERLAKTLAADAYSARPYRSWERGLNENTNGPLRRYFPKGSSFDELTERELRRVESKLNHRP